jgi:hypothetical protein
MQSCEVEALPASSRDDGIRDYCISDDHISDDWSDPLRKPSHISHD